jgi:hypothetical protein
MADDFYLRSGARQYQVLQAGRAAALADLESHKLNGDHDSAAETIQQIATIDTAMRDLNDLQNRYVQSQQPPPEPSREERLAKPINKMTYADVYEMCKSGSKHGVDDAAFVAGIHEAARRRARGE